MGEMAVPFGSMNDAKILAAFSCVTKRHEQAGVVGSLGDGFFFAAS